MPAEVSNDGLNARAVPPVTASWHTIGSFALTLNGYKAIGENECGQLANRVRSEFTTDGACFQSLSLTELRVCLFFEQRRFRHFNDEPEGDDRIYINALLEDSEKGVNNAIRVSPRNPHISVVRTEDKTVCAGKRLGGLA